MQRRRDGGIHVRVQHLPGVYWAEAAGYGPGGVYVDAMGPRREYKGHAQQRSALSLAKADRSKVRVAAQAAARVMEVE